jgi:hypothetical protein
MNGFFAYWLTPGGKNLLPATGLCHFLRRFDRTGRICMGWQLIAMGMGVRSMSWGKGRFRDCLMLLVRQGIIHGVMTGVFQVTFTVLAWPGFHYGFFLPIIFWR